MHKKQLLVIGLVALTLASMLILSVGTAFAQDDMPPGGYDGSHGHSNHGNHGGHGSHHGDHHGNHGTGYGHGHGAHDRGDKTGCDALPPATPGELPSDVVDALVDAMHDEQHAYAVYAMVMDQFGTVAPFDRIQAAEVQHMAALEVLFDRYDIAVPEAPTFDPLVVDSVAEACAVGVEAEIANAEMYVDLFEAVQDYPDIMAVFTRLRDASWDNHLPAFEHCAQ